MNRKKILIAEPNSVLSLVLKFKLEKEGYELIMASNGQEALDLIESKKPDLILTEAMMDYVSGLELISYVRNELKYTTPILVFSTLAQEENVLNAYNLGANEFMSKPLKLEELVIRVKMLLFN